MAQEELTGSSKLIDAQASVLASVGETYLAPAQPTAAPSLNLDFGASVQSGFQDISTINSVGLAVADVANSPMVRGIDVEYIQNREEMIAGNEPLAASLAELQTLSKTSHGASQLLDDYYKATSFREAQYILGERWAQQKEIERLARGDADNIGYTLGAIAALGLDAAAYFAIGSVTLGAGTVAGAATSAARLSTVASRAAAAGAIDATIDSVARNQWDKSFTGTDALINIGLGAVASGALATGATAGFRKWQSRTVNRVNIEDNAARALDELEVNARLSNGESIGAAKVGETGEVLDEVSTQQVSSMTTGGKLSPDILVGPKQKAKRRVDMAGSEGTPLGVTRAGQIYNRLWNLSGTTDQARAHLKSTRTVESHMVLLRDNLRMLRTKVDDLDTKFVRENYARRALTLGLTRAAPDRNVRRNQADMLMVAESNLTTATKDVGDWEAKVNKTAINIATAKEGTDTAKLKKQMAYEQKRMASAAKTQELAQRAIPEVNENIRSQALTDGVDAEKYAAHIRAMGDLDNGWYKEMGDTAKELGLLKMDEVPTGHRPQQWNPEAIMAYESEFRGILYTTMLSNPDGAYLLKVAKDAGLEIPDDVVDTLDMNTLAKMDLDTAARAQEEWHDAVIEAAEDEAVNLIRAAEWKHSDAFGPAFNRVQEEHFFKAEELQAKAQVHIDEITDFRRSITDEDLGSTEVTSSIDELVHKITKLEYEAEGFRTKASDMEKLRGDSLKMEDFVRDNKQMLSGTPHTPAKIDAKLARKRASASKRADAKISKVDVKERIDDVISNLTGQRAINPFETEDITQTVTALKDRTINLTGLHHDQSVQRFLRQGADDILQGYGESVGIQKALHLGFGDVLRDSGHLKEGDIHISDALRKYLKDAYRADIKNADTPQAKEMLEGEFKRDDKLLTSALQEFTRADRAKQYATESGAGWDRASGIVGSLLSMTLLNRAVLSSLGDLSVMASGSGRSVNPVTRVFGHLLADTFSGGGDKTLKNMDMRQWVSVRGTQVLDQAEFGNKYDSDIAPYYVGAGTKLRSIELKVQEMNTVAQWLNMSSPYDLFVRKVVGSMSGHFIREDAVKGWDSLGRGVQEAYARAGMSKQDLEAFKVLTKAMGTIKDGFNRLPNTSEWGKKAVVQGRDGSMRVVDLDGPVPSNGISGTSLRETYLNGLNRMASQMKLDPSIGDRPFFHRHPAGRLFTQFQSFVYAAGERWVWPMVQELKMNPASARYVMALVMSIGLSSLNIAARDQLDGRDSSTLRLLRGEGSGEDTWVAISSAIRRSPLMLGMLTQVVEASQQSVGRLVNESAGVSVFAPESVKYRHGQGWGGILLGPLGGTVTRVGNNVTRLADGKVEEGLTGLSKMTPLLGSIYMQLLLQYMTNQ